MKAPQLQARDADASLCNVNQAARLRRLLMILSLSTARPGIRAGDLAAALKVSERTIFRDLAELQRLGFPGAFGNGYPSQQELFQRRVPRPVSQVVADLVDQQLEVARMKLPPADADAILAVAAQFLPYEAAEAVSRAVAQGQRQLALRQAGRA
jgi:predicted DNA-binding transcriptional regulator YafY